MGANLGELEARVGYHFLDRSILERALLHATAAEGQRRPDNRALAFLGDAVIELAVRAQAVRTSPDATPRDLSEGADRVVPDAELARSARRLGLEQWLQVGIGEANNRAGEDRRLADALEALAGAIYLDAGLHAFPVVYRLLNVKAD